MSRKEYLALIRDVRYFLEVKLPKSVLEKEPLSPQSRVQKGEIPLIATPPKPPPPKIVPPSLVATEVSGVKKGPPIRNAVSAGNWELHPMPPVENESLFYQKLAPFVKVCEPLAAVCLVLPQEEGAHRLFLENVSRAITRAFAPAVVVLNRRSLFSSFRGHLILAPLELLVKEYPSASPHQTIQGENFSILPLESLDSYGQDQHAKRALWKAIQHSFQS